MNLYSIHKIEFKRYIKSEVNVYAVTHQKKCPEEIIEDSKQYVFAFVVIHCSIYMIYTMMASVSEPKTTPSSLYAISENFRSCFKCCNGIYVFENMKVIIFTLHSEWRIHWKPEWPYYNHFGLFSQTLVAKWLLVLPKVFATHQICIPKCRKKTLMEIYRIKSCR